MKKIYMLISDADNIAIDNTFFCSRKEDAEKMVEYGEVEYYEIVTVLDSIEIDNICKSKVARG